MSFREATSQALRSGIERLARVPSAALLQVILFPAYSFYDMARPAAIFSGLLAMTCSLVYSVPSSAQYPDPPVRCSLPAVSRNTIIPSRKVVIKRLDFDGPIHLSHSDVARIIKEANQKELNADDSDWINDFTENILRDFWLNRGYLNVKVTAQARSLGGDSSQERLLVTGHVDEGLQYRLKSIRFDGDSPISEEELRAAVPIRDGDIFNVQLIRNGINGLTGLHSSRGYIDFTAAPDTEIDDDQKPWISLVFHLDVQKQYRVGHLEVVALDPNLITRIRDIVRPGDIYSFDVVEKLFNDNKSVLPPGVWLTDVVSLDRDFRAGTVDLAFDFRACPHR